MTTEGSGSSSSGVAAGNADDPLVGQVVAGRFKILGFVAKGGMGRIYRAEQIPLGRMVALKVLHSHYTGSGGDPEFQRRFLREAATCARLTHPNTVRVFDYGKIEGSSEDTYFMVMELIEGRTLTRAIRSDGPFHPARAFAIARLIARALREAHRLGIVHRDLKSSNVMLVQGDEGEQVKVLDFGLAKVLRDDSEDLTLEGKFLGSPRYMAPEQIRHEPIDGRADLYSLGVILYEMLCGRVPFDAGQAIHTLMAHLSDPVPWMAQRTGVSVVPELEAVVRRCLEKSPDNRFANVDELLSAMQSVAPLFSDDSGIRSSESWILPAVAAPPAHEPAKPTSPTPADATAGATIPIDLSAVPAAPLSAALAAHSFASAQPRLAPELSDSTTSRAGKSVVLLAVGGILAVGLLLGIWWPGSSGPAAGQAVDRPTAVSLPRAGKTTSQPARSAPTPSLEVGDGARLARSSQPGPAPDPAAATLRIESTPRDAEVWDGDRLLGTTPLTVSLDPHAPPHSIRRFSIRRDGFATETVEQGPARGDVVRQIQLRRAKRSVGRSPGRGPQGPPSRPDLEILNTR